MPFAKTWSEELVAEWLQLNGYLVEIGVPTGTSSKGGRGEADVIGAKIINNTLEIVHVEVGQLLTGEEYTRETLEKKFSQKTCDLIKEYFKQRFGFTGNCVKYKKMYIMTYGSQKASEISSELGIEVKKLPEFIKQDVIQTIQNWKQQPPHKPKSQGKMITLPQSHWVLQLIDYLYNEKIILL